MSKTSKRLDDIQAKITAGEKLTTDDGNYLTSLKYDRRYRDDDRNRAVGLKERHRKIEAAKRQAELQAHLAACEARVQAAQDARVRNAYEAGEMIGEAKRVIH
jgi:hypothetical protein